MKSLSHRKLSFGEEINIPLLKNKNVNMVACPLTKQRPAGILGTKHVDGPPIVQNSKPRKAVRFNMDKNETCEIIQPELNEDDDDDDNDDEEETDDKQLSVKTKNGILGHLLDACDLGMSDDDDEDVGKKLNGMKDENNNTAYSQEIGTNYSIAVEKNLIKDDITDLEKERKSLLDDVMKLRKRHEKEMRQLREEYQRRREDYYTELDDVRSEINEKRSKYQEEAIDEEKQTNPMLKEINTRIHKSKEELETQEKELSDRKTEVAEEENELRDYQRYLERRHKSLNEKEEDLCKLQDELEELDDVLKEKKKKLLQEQGTLDGMNILKPCKHDENEIEKMRTELTQSMKMEFELREQIRAKETEYKHRLDEMSTLDDENKKLKAKIKLLESQLTINLKSSFSGATLAERKASMRLMSSIPVNEKTGEYKSPHCSLKSANFLSPSSSRSNSPSHDRLPPSRQFAVDNSCSNGSEVHIKNDDLISAKSKTCLIM